MSKHEFTRQAQALGWDMISLGERWGLKPRQMSNIARKPKQIHWDALKGAGWHI